MMNSVKISKSGVEMSHDRYISDNSTGLLLWLNIVMLVEYKIVPISFSFSLNPISNDVLILFILFLLSTPFGMIASVLSFITLEKFYYKTEKLWWIFRTPVKAIKYCDRFDDGLEYYHLSWSNWQSNLLIMEGILLANNIDINKFTIQRCLRILLRNISFFMFVDVVFCLIFEKWLQSGMFFMIGIIFLFMASYIGLLADVILFCKYDIYYRFGYLQKK